MSRCTWMAISVLSLSGNISKDVPSSKACVLINSINMKGYSLLKQNDKILNYFQRSVRNQQIFRSPRTPNTLHSASFNDRCWCFFGSSFVFKSLIPKESKPHVDYIMFSNFLMLFEILEYDCWMKASEQCFFFSFFFSQCWSNFKVSDKTLLVWPFK